MNIIPKIAEMLGVEIGEEFEANGKTVKFTEDALIHYNCDGEKEWWNRAECTLIGLINGSYEVKKPPFEPKDGERYWYVYWNFTLEYPCVTDISFEDSDVCYHHRYCGNCFRTKEEAEKHKFEIYEKLTGRKWEE